MKTLMIIPMLLISLASNTRATTNAFESITISPLYQKKESTIVVKTKSSYLKFLVFLQNDKYTNICIAQGEITKAGTYTYKYMNTYTRNQNQVYIRYCTSSTSFVDTPSGERNVSKPHYAYIEDNRSITETSTLLVFNPDHSITTRKLTYSFSGFEGIYVPAFYHKIDLRDFKITLAKDDQVFFNGPNYLVISNYDGVFSDIEGASKTVTIELKKSATGDVISFLPKSDLYVHPETLALSSTQKTGYVKTRHIYLPRNEMRNQDKYECYLKFEDFGAGKDVVYHNFKILALKNIFGDCSNSQYCIINE